MLVLVKPTRCEKSTEDEDNEDLGERSKFGGEIPSTLANGGTSALGRSSGPQNQLYLMETR